MQAEPLPARTPSAGSFRCSWQGLGIPCGWQEWGNLIDLKSWDNIIIGTLINNTYIHIHAYMHACIHACIHNLDISIWVCQVTSDEYGKWYRIKQRYFILAWDNTWAPRVDGSSADSASGLCGHSCRFQCQRVAPCQPLHHCMLRCCSMLLNMFGSLSGERGTNPSLSGLKVQDAQPATYIFLFHSNAFPNRPQNGWWIWFDCMLCCFRRSEARPPNRPSIYHQVASKCWECPPSQEKSADKALLKKRSTKKELQTAQAKAAAAQGPTLGKQFCDC